MSVRMFFGFTNSKKTRLFFVNVQHCLQIYASRAMGHSKVLHMDLIGCGWDADTVYFFN